ncbi:hypothetical protein QP880_05305 [Dermabacter hominis]|uniref:hypothetical protein n=1 Tax=Dermabacter hominis TaxID=36740 RepID=UPI00316ADCDA|nr:hypothetical protein [Dermabacter hominis]
MAKNHEPLNLYKGRVRPGRVAWTRVILTLVIGTAICLSVLLTFGETFMPRWIQKRADYDLAA